MCAVQGAGPNKRLRRDLRDIERLRALATAKDQQQDKGGESAAGTEAQA